jgi:hypothetical protein
LTLPVALFLVLWVGAPAAAGQSLAGADASKKMTVAADGQTAASGSSGVATPDAPAPDMESRVRALEEALRAENAKLEEMQKVIAEQQQTIRRLSEKPPGGDAGGSEAPDRAAAATPATGAQAQAPALETRVKNLEERVQKVGPFRLSGDFRLRADAIFRSATRPPAPPLTHVQNVRARYRLRLNFDTDLYPSLSFHGQLATGPVNNPLTNDQDFGETVARHPFFINEAWVDYHPRKSVQLQAGRLQEVFADNSRFLFDDDVRFNGFNEKYVRNFKHPAAYVTSVEARAGQYILSNPNVAVVTAGSPLAQAGAVVGSTGRASNLFHQGLLFNQRYNKRWDGQFGGDVQLYRNPNQIQLASTANGVVLIVQNGLGLALSGPLPGAGNATTTPGGAIYTARNFEIARLTYRLTWAGFKSGEHAYPVTFNIQGARNMGVGAEERDAMLAAVQVGRITKRGDTSYLYVFSVKGANSLISQLTDDDLGTGSGVNIRTHHFRFEYGVARKVTFQSLLFVQSQLRNSGDFPNFFVPLGAFAPRTYRLMEQVVFSF